MTTEVPVSRPAATRNQDWLPLTGRDRVSDGIPDSMALPLASASILPNYRAVDRPCERVGSRAIAVSLAFHIAAMGAAIMLYKPDGGAGGGTHAPLTVTLLSQTSPARVGSPSSSVRRAEAPRTTATVIAPQTPPDPPDPPVTVTLNDASPPSQSTGLHAPAAFTPPTYAAPIAPAPQPPLQPTPPAAQSADPPATDRWERAVVVRLAKRRRYPAEAIRAGLTDEILLRLVLDRKGYLLGAELVRSRGVRSLDNEAMAMAERASPYPIPPPTLPGAVVRVLVPVQFALRGKD